MTDELCTYKVDYYEDTQGREPVIDWLLSIDQSMRARIKARITRLRLGQLGDYRALGAGLFELKMHFGPGYRIYFGYLSDKWVLLLVGGDKGSQDRDIRKARKCWDEYLRRKR